MSIIDNHLKNGYTFGLLRTCPFCNGEGAVADWSNARKMIESSGQSWPVPIVEKSDRTISCPNCLKGWQLVLVSSETFVEWTMEQLVRSHMEKPNVLLKALVAAVEKEMLAEKAK
jgi:hypothetical protein